MNAAAGSRAPRDRGGFGETALPAARWGYRALPLVAAVFASLGAWAAPKWTASVYSNVDISGNLLAWRYLDPVPASSVLELCDGSKDRFEFAGNKTVTWLFPVAATINSISIYTTWGDTGRDDLVVSSVAVRYAGSEEWTTFGNSSVDTRSNGSVSIRVLSVFADEDGVTPIGETVTGLRIAFPAQENSFAGFLEVVARGSFNETPPEPEESPYVWTGGDYNPGTWAASESNMMSTCSSIFYNGSQTTSYNQMTDGAVVQYTSYIEKGKLLVFKFAQAFDFYELKVFSRWNDSGRDAISIIKIEVQDEEGIWTTVTDANSSCTVGSAKSFDMYSSSSAGTGHMYVHLRRKDGGKIASGVKAIRVTPWFHPSPSCWAEFEMIGVLPAAGAIFDNRAVTVDNDCWQVNWTARVVSLGASDRATVNLWTSFNNVNFTLADTKEITEINTPYPFTTTLDDVNLTLYYFFETVNANGGTEWRATNETASVVNHDNAIYWWRPDVASGAWENGGSWSNSHNDARLSYPDGRYATADFSLADTSRPVAVSLSAAHTVKFAWPQPSATVSFTSSSSVAITNSSSSTSVRGTNVFVGVSLKMPETYFLAGARLRLADGAKALLGTTYMSGARCGIELESDAELSFGGYVQFCNNAEILLNGGSVVNASYFTWSGAVSSLAGHIVFGSNGGRFISPSTHSFVFTVTTPLELRYEMRGMDWRGYDDAPLALGYVNDMHIFGGNNGKVFVNVEKGAGTPTKALDLKLISTTDSKAYIATNGFTFAAFGESVCAGEASKKGDTFLWTYDHNGSLEPATPGSRPTGLILRYAGRRRAMTILVR